MSWDFTKLYGIQEARFSRQNSEIPEFNFSQNEFVSKKTSIFSLNYL